MKKITHIIFAGHAMRSLNLLGVLRYLYFYNLHNDIKSVIGSSMGSFFGLALTLKIPFEDLEKYIKKIVEDDEIMNIKTEHFSNLFMNNGIDKTYNYLIYFKEYIKKKYDIEDITFIELAKKTGIDFNVSTTNVNNYKNQIFNLTNTPNVSVFDAVSASMTLPFLSQPVLIDGYYYIDGGITNNFPIELYNDIPKENVLGVITIIEDHVADNIPKNSNINFYDYSLRILNFLIINTTLTMLTSKINKNNNHILTIDKSSILSFDVEINNNIIHKKMSIDDVDKLIFEGYKYMFDYMKKFEK